jgi:hypothetical protein
MKRFGDTFSVGIGNAYDITDAISVLLSQDPETLDVESAQDALLTLGEPCDDLAPSISAVLRACNPDYVATVLQFWKHVTTSQTLSMCRDKVFQDIETNVAPFSEWFKSEVSTAAVFSPPWVASIESKVVEGGAGEPTTIKPELMKSMLDAVNCCTGSNIDAVLLNQVSIAYRLVSLWAVSPSVVQLESATGADAVISRDRHNQVATLIAKDSQLQELVDGIYRSYEQDRGITVQVKTPDVLRLAIARDGSGSPHPIKVLDEVDFATLVVLTLAGSLRMIVAMQQRWSKD